MSVKLQETYKLIVPVTFEGVERTEITLRRMKAKDLKKVKGNNDMEDTLAIIVSLSGWPPEGVGEIDAEDLAGIGEIIEGFTGKRRS